MYCSNPRNAKGLLTSAIESNDPVIFFEPKRCYRGPFYGDPHNVPTWNNHPDGEVPEDYYAIPLEQANIVQEGSACTVIAWGAMVHVCEQAIKDSGVDCELIDLQTLVPWDRDTVVNSVKKTGRVVIVHEAPKTSGFGAEMSASIQERCFYHLEAPIERVHWLGHTLPPHDRMGLPAQSISHCRSHTKNTGGMNMGKFEFKLPDIGEGVVEGEIVEWMVAVEDTVKEDDPILSVMTDKATVEIPAPCDGTVASIVGEAGDILPVGGVCIVFDVDGEGNASASSEPVAEEAPAVEEVAAPVAEEKAPEPAPAPTLLPLRQQPPLRWLVLPARRPSPRQPFASEPVPPTSTSNWLQARVLLGASATPTSTGTSPAVPPQQPQRCPWVASPRSPETAPRTSRSSGCDARLPTA